VCIGRRGRAARCPKVGLINQLMGIGKITNASVTHAKYVNRDGTKNTKEYQFGRIGSHEGKEKSPDSEEAAENDRRPGI
jgi:hypothetical protein